MDKMEPFKEAKDKEIKERKAQNTDERKTLKEAKSKDSEKRKAQSMNKKRCFKEAKNKENEKIRALRSKEEYCKAIGETVMEIAQTTKYLVIGGRETDDEILGFESSQYKEQQKGVARRGQSN